MKDTKKSGPVVYIVDDDNSMREALTLLLKTVGYTTAPFARPGDFLAKHDRTSPAASCSTSACRR